MKISILVLAAAASLGCTQTWTSRRIGARGVAVAAERPVR